MSTPAITQPGPKSQRQLALEEWGELDAAYSSWRGTHEDIINFTQPGRGRFTDSEANKGERKDQLIVNDTAVDATKRLGAAMDTGITSPAREWLRLMISRASDQLDAARGYLHEVQEWLFGAFARSNYYTTHRNVYLDLIGPGVSLMWIEEDDEDIVRFTHIPIGQYRLATDARGRVCKVKRRFQMTGNQMVERFGRDNCSEAVRQAVDNNAGQTQVLVQHDVYERKDRKYGKIDKKNKPWASCWLEVSVPDGDDKLLLESGYDEKPFVAPRWDVVGEDAYGKGSPGWQTLGDAKTLQPLNKGNAKTLALIAQPPLGVPHGMQNARLVPGAMNHLPEGAKFKAEPLVNIHPSAVTVGQDEETRKERRIQRGYFVDVLMFISHDERSDRATATEINAQKDERLLQLGGTFGRVADEDLKPTVNRVLAIGQRGGFVEPPPQDLGEVNIEFENILVAAQKTIGISAVDRGIAVAAGLASIGRKDALEKLDVDEIIEGAFDMLGVPPKMLLSDEKLQALREARAKRDQAAQMGAAAAQGAGTIKDLASTDPEQLNQLVDRFGPAARAAATGQG